MLPRPCMLGSRNARIHMLTRSNQPLITTVHVDTCQGDSVFNPLTGWASKPCLMSHLCAQLREPSVQLSWLKGANDQQQVVAYVSTYKLAGHTVCASSMLSQPQDHTMHNAAH